MRRWIAVALAGCWAPPPYEPGMLDGSLSHHGCLDIALRGAWPLFATGPVLVIGLGNRCEHGVPVDLRGLRIVGGGHDGVRVSMIPYDPRHEIRELRIDARRHGDEWIEVHPALPPYDPLQWLDVDLGPIVGSAEQWVRISVPRYVQP